jgi:ESS family glutamate:Na+ symporter
MTTVQVNLLYTLVVTLLVFFAGQLLVRRVAALQRFSLPPPVVGGCLIAVILAMADGFASTRVSFDMSLKDSLLISFFTTVGLAADARMLVKGGTKLAIFLLVCSVFIVFQNVVGLTAAWAMDMHPVFGLFGGSVTLTGGHGTGAAYAARLGETMNLHSAMELTMAFATAGLVVGALMGGPLGVYLIKRHGLSGPTQAKAAKVAKAKAGKSKATLPAGQEQTVTTQSFLGALFLVLVCLASGRLLANWMEGGGLILPDFLFALLLGVLIRNIASFTGLFRIDDRSIELIGGVSLSLFLVMALMSMKLLDLVSMAGPLLLILVLQAVTMAFYAVFVTFRIMGKDYDAAIMAAGHVGFGMSSTAAALAIMKAITERTGLSPLAFLIVPMVGAFFIDVMNALIIQGFLALPAFGF